MVGFHFILHPSAFILDLQGRSHVRFVSGAPVPRQKAKGGRQKEPCSVVDFHFILHPSAFILDLQGRLHVRFVSGVPKGFAIRLAYRSQI